MDFERKVGLIEFGEAVFERFNDRYNSEKYRRDVASVLLRHKAEFWRTQEMSEMPDIWRSWLLDARDNDWFEGKYRAVLSITDGTFTELSKGRGLIERAIAVHYRMHRSLEEKELELALEMDQSIFECDAVTKLGNVFEYRPPDPSSFDGVNFAHELATLEGTGWTQMAANSVDYELETELFCRQVTRWLNGRRLRYGLREVWVRVEGTNFDVVRQYRGGEMDLPKHLHYHGRETWRVNASDGPTDNFGMLDGSVLAGPICVANPTGKQSSGLKVEVYIPKTTPKLTILADTTDDESNAEDWERQNLIEKMFLIYLHKLHQLDSDHITLSSKDLVV